MTRWQQHVSQWKDCQRCSLCSGRARVVLARGTIPCRVLFIGEAPGESEDAIGQPFVGPAGHLLNSIIAEALPADAPYALTNLVGCVPREDDGSKTTEPPTEAIEACATRLEEMVTLCDPLLLVCVGALAENWIMGTKGKRHLLPGYSGKLVAITHPAAILRANVAQRGLMIQRCIARIAVAYEECPPF